MHIMTEFVFDVREFLDHLLFIYLGRLPLRQKRKLEINNFNVSCP